MISNSGALAGAVRFGDASKHYKNRCVQRQRLLWLERGDDFRAWVLPDHTIIVVSTILPAGLPACRPACRPACCKTCDFSVRNAKTSFRYRDRTARYPEVRSLGMNFRFDQTSRGGLLLSPCGATKRPAALARAQRPKRSASLPFSASSTGAT